MSTAVTNLKQLYEKCLNDIETLDSSVGNSQKKENTAKSLDDLIQCRRLVDQLALFSPNEDIEELGTSDLPYMTLDYRIANLLEHAPMDFKPGFDRQMLVNQAMAYYIQYLQLLAGYGILDADIKRKVQQATSNGDNNKFDVACLKSKDAAAERAEKIRMFKMETELKKQLHPTETKSDEADDRKLRIAELNLFAIKAISSLPTLQMEKTLLANRPPPEELRKLDEQRSMLDPATRQREQNKSPADRFTTRVELPENSKPLLTSTGKVNRPFTIVSSRDQLKKQVFGTGQVLPTMTLDEYVEEEIKRGGIVQGPSGEASRAKESDSEEDDNEKADAATYKAREWDEFTDNNPRGSGNTMNIG